MINHIIIDIDNTYIQQNCWRDSNLAEVAWLAVWEISRERENMFLIGIRNGRRLYANYDDRHSRYLFAL